MRYRILVDEIWRSEYTVEAINEEDAMKKFSDGVDSTLLEDKDKHKFLYFETNGVDVVPDEEPLA